MVDYDKTIAIKRSDDAGLDTLFDYNANDVENKSTIEVCGNSSLIELLDEYKKGINDHYEDYKFPRIIDEATFTPDEISTFIQFIEPFHIKIKDKRITKEFIQRMVKKSYNEGYNNFNFSTVGMGDEVISLSRIDASIDNPLNVNIVGNVGHDFGWKSKNIIINLKGNVGYYFGNTTHNLFANIEGNVGNFFGFNSVNLIASIKGNVKENFGTSSLRLAAKIHGNVNGSFGVNSDNLVAYIQGNFIGDSFHDSHHHKVLIDGKLHNQPFSGVISYDHWGAIRMADYRSNKISQEIIQTLEARFK
jgi:hypothetical protein